MIHVCVILTFKLVKCILQHRFERSKSDKLGCFLIFYFFLQDSRRSLRPRSRRAAAPLAHVHLGTQAFPRDMDSHELRAGLCPGPGVARGPQLPHRLQPLPQNGVRDQIPHPEDPPCPESVSLGEI